MRTSIKSLSFLISVSLLFMVGHFGLIQQANGQTLNDAQAVAYDGPQARVAVARFENKSSDSYSWYNPQIGDGMADMLTTALVNSGRYIVLERESLDVVLYEQDLGDSGRIRQDTAAAIGEIEGAELLIVAAVTEFEGDAGGTQAGLGGFGGRVLGAVTGGARSAHMAIDLRVVDARTSRILAATSVEGRARDFNAGAAAGGYFRGGGALGGGLSTWQNTPREKALREVINKSVDYVVSVTPAQYLRHGGAQPGAITAVTSTAAAVTSGNSSQRAVITVGSLNVHQAPDTSSAAQFSLASGIIVEVVAKTVNGWMLIRDPQGREGWISAQSATLLQE